VKTNDGEWYDLASQSVVARAQGFGVYVIWTPNDKPDRPAKVLKVGSGNLPVRLYLEGLSRELRWIGVSPKLVTWAVADPDLHPGIVRYLCQQFSPFFQDAAVPGEPVEVNLPLSA